MKFLAQKIQAGVINLKTMSTARLVQLSSEVESHRDKDIIGCELMYRKEGKE